MNIRIQVANNGGWIFIVDTPIQAPEHITTPRMGRQMSTYIAKTNDEALEIFKKLIDGQI